MFVSPEGNKELVLGTKIDQLRLKSESMKFLIRNILFN